MFKTLPQRVMTMQKTLPIDRVSPNELPAQINFGKITTMPIFKKVPMIGSSFRKFPLDNMPTIFKKNMN